MKKTTWLGKLGTGTVQTSTLKHKEIKTSLGTVPVRLDKVENEYFVYFDATVDRTFETLEDATNHFNNI